MEPREIVRKIKELENVSLPAIEEVYPFL